MENWIHIKWLTIIFSVKLNKNIKPEKERMKRRGDDVEICRVRGATWRDLQKHFCHAINILDLTIFGSSVMIKALKCYLRFFPSFQPQTFNTQVIDRWKPRKYIDTIHARISFISTTLSISFSVSHLCFFSPNKNQ